MLSLFIFRCNLFNDVFSTEQDQRMNMLDKQERMNNVQWFSVLCSVQVFPQKTKLKYVVSEPEGLSPCSQGPATGANPELFPLKD
jgi:hypothetical protein